jgi:hypothetical protein
MRKFIFASLLHCMMLASALAADSYSVVLRAEQWDLQRNGEALLGNTDLSDMVQRWMSTPGGIIELRYPGGEEGELWVHELMDWLVALGIPSSAMQIFPGSGSNDTILLVLVHGSN